MTKITIPVGTIFIQFDSTHKPIIYCTTEVIEVEPLNQDDETGQVTDIQGTLLMVHTHDFYDMEHLYDDEFFLLADYDSFTLFFPVYAYNGDAGVFGHFVNEIQHNLLKETLKNI